MTRKVCAEPGCPTITDATRCPKHTQAKDRARGTRQQRGYDAAHDAERKRWAPLVATGMVKCWRCRLPIGPGEPWDLGHDDQDRSKYRGPEHAEKTDDHPACNRATSGRRISPDA